MIALKRFSRTIAATILTAACFIPAFAPVGCSAANVAVLTQHDDNNRTGNNPNETTLTPQDVNSTDFGALFTISLDDDVSGQALYVPKLTIEGAVHNTLFVYTTGNYDNSPSSVYAFDADHANGGHYLWRLQLPNSAQWTTCAPVIDTTTHLIYVLTKEPNNDGTNQLHAINILNGSEMPGSPVTIAGSVAGTGDGSSGGTVTFDSAQENCRPGLLLVNGVVYIAFAHNTDSFPYHGWVYGYKYGGTAFSRTAIFCTTPNSGMGGIWQTGNGLVADSSGNIYAATGNGGFDAANTPPGIDYGMSYIKLSTPDLKVVDWFSPNDEASDSSSDLDLAGAGLVGIPNTSRIFGGGSKFGSAFLLNTGNMGGFTPNGPDKVLNRIDGVSPDNSVGQNPVCWDKGPEKFVYLWPGGANLQQFRYLTVNGKIVPNVAFKSWGNTVGAQLSLSSNLGANGILWAQCYDNVVRAFKAEDVSAGELWDSSINASRDGIDSIGHWQFITVASGHVYVPTGNAEIVVYGLLPKAK